MAHRLPDPKDRLLQAGIDAIRIGVEDFSTPNRARRTAAIRNLYAGILLLAKHLLVQMAPKGQPLLLIAAKTKFIRDEDGELYQVADSRQTLGANDILRRFEELGLDLDTRHLKRLQRLRNDIEHYFTEARNEDFEEAFVEVQLLVSDLLARIGADPDLGPSWRRHVEASKAFEARRKKSRRDLKQIAWISPTVEQLLVDHADLLECPSCASSHLVRDDGKQTEQDKIELKCLACATEVPIGSALEPLLAFEFSGVDHEAALCGEEGELYKCPDCECETYLAREDQCAACGAGTDNYSCEHCGEKMPIWGVANGHPYCSDDCALIAHRLSKDD